MTSFTSAVGAVTTFDPVKPHTRKSWNLDESIANAANRGTMITLQATLISLDPWINTQAA